MNQLYVQPVQNKLVEKHGVREQNNNSRGWFLGAVPVSSNWWPVSPLSVVGDPLSGEHLVEHLVKTNSTPCSTLGQLGKQIENLLA